MERFNHIRKKSIDIAYGFVLINNSFSLVHLTEYGYSKMCVKYGNWRQNSVSGFLSLNIGFVYDYQ